MINMIVVLCNSFEEAQDAFARFMDFLEKFDPLSITNVFEYSYAVETDKDFRYIFVDYRFKLLASKFDRVVDFIDYDEFFEDIDEMFY